MNFWPGPDKKERGRATIFHPHPKKLPVTFSEKNFKKI